MISRVSAAVLGQDKRGKPRCYMQGRWLSRFGLLPGARVRVSYQDGLVVVLLDEEGPRKVSGKGEVPVIDLQGEELGKALGQDGAALEIRAAAGRIVIRPARTEEQKRKRTRNGLEGSLFSGGGLLTQAAKLVGFRPSFAVEIEPRYAEIFERNHEGSMLNTSVHEVRAEDLHQVELLTVGLCCEPFSKKRREAGSKLPPEAHPNGDLVVWALRAVEAANPWTVVVEQVPEFLDSGAGWILRHALSRMGYTVEARVLDPCDYGELAGRRRAVLVATNDAEVRWPEPTSSHRRLGEVLEDGEHAWFDRDTKGWLFSHWEKQAAKGNRFFEGRQVLDAETRRVPCVSKRYFAQQGDGVVVKHPTRPGVFRWLTLNEVKRLMGLDDDYDLGDAKTRAGEVLGQGVHVGLFRRVIEAVTGRAP